MSRTARLGVYRASLASTMRSLVGGAVVLILGLVMVTNGGGISVVVLGALVLLFSAWLVADVVTDRIIVTPDGLEYIDHLRRKSLNWAEIHSFGVGYGRGRRWSTLIIIRTDGSSLVTDFNSLTRRHPSWIAHELTEWQRKLAPPKATP